MGSKKKNSEKKKEPGNADTSRAAQDASGGHGDKTISTDPRFASVHLDPRFAKLPQHKAKVTIDSRFNRMFTDKNFASSTAQIDKRGKAKKDSSREALKHYYRLEEEEEEEPKKKLKGREEVEDEEFESDEESDEIEGEPEKPGVYLSDLEMGTDSDEEEESNDESSADTEEEDENDLSSAEEDTFVQDENVPEIDKETHRLAVVNLDWGRVKAVDLYVLFSSLLRKGGQVLSVAVYPSEFGLQRMEEEALRGPVGLFDDEKDKSGSDDDNDDDDDDEIDNEKLRAYERSRLRYYYAVVKCDSIATADYLYKTCDGVEFERSSNKLDLRFIPDSMEFKHPPRDVANGVPADYEGLDFQTRALQMSKIDLTWDEDEPQRTRSLKRKFNAEQLADMEMKEFLASDESDADEDENDEIADQSEKKHKKKDMYRALLQSGEGSDEDDEDGQDMEVTFNTGLEDLSKRLLEKKDTKSETVWEQHLKKMKEKKKARRNRSKSSSEDESYEDDEPAEETDDFFVDESSVKGGKGKSNQKGKKNKEVDKDAEDKSRAELELLLADENGADAGVKGYNMKRRKGNGKKGKDIPDEGKIPTIDYEDQRFSSLFTSPLFALDPTDPQFKRSAAYAKQLTQKQRMGEEEEPVIKPHGKLARPPQVDVTTGKNERKDKHELSSLVKSIKMKSKLRLPSNGKVSTKAANSKGKHRM